MRWCIRFKTLSITRSDIAGGIPLVLSEILFWRLYKPDERVWTPLVSKQLHKSKSQAYIRGELSYLAPLGSENISAPYFKQCSFQVGVLPPRLSQTPRLPVQRQK